MSKVSALIPERKAWILCILATLTMTVSYIDRQTFAVLSPLFTKDLGLNDMQFGWLASAFSFAYLAATPLAGRWMDRIGARKGLTLALVIWSGVAMLHSVMLGFWSLLALRILLGISESPSFPGATQTVHRTLPKAERSRAFGLLFTGSSIGAMTAAPLASYLAEHLGYRAGFIGTAVVGMLWLPFWIWNSRSAEVKAVFATEPAALPGSPTPGRSMLLRNRHLWRGAAAVLASAPLAAFAFLWAPKFFDKTFHLTQVQLGFYLMVPPLCFDLGSLFFGEWGTRRQRRMPGSQAFAPFLVSMVLIACIGALGYASDPLSALAIIGFGMAGAGGMFAILTAEMLGQLPGSVVAEASGWVAATQSLAYIITNVGLGYALQAFGSYQMVLVILACVSLPFGALWFYLSPQSVTGPVASIPES